jgi:dipeptidyl aminopeptidase/acylaminoacyl peptidase
VIASGYDFYSTPRLSPDGSRLAWLCWRHPQMPWDGTELWVADVDESGALSDQRQLAGGSAESIYQPGWSPDGGLVFVSDTGGWWNIRRSDGSGRSDARPLLVTPLDGAEFGRPQWILGGSTWAFANRSLLVAAYTRGGRWHLATVDVDSGTLADIPTNLQPREWVVATRTHAIVVAGNAATPDAVVSVSLADGRVETIRASADQVVDRAFLSVPEAIEFPASTNRTAHAFYYPPRHADRVAETPPPLIVISHGGPTTAAIEAYDLKLQFWTSRGFAVVDVNYGGSSGFGRQYRQRLDGQWGIVDVEDCVAAARHLAATGRADPARLIIRGGSAGGYTTLAALAFHPGVFTAGASYYGISDIEVLATDTHKFESRYLDTLIGPYPETAALYKARSPIHAVGNMVCPLILFQGLDDTVVPPNQSQMMADALRAKGIEVVYLAFAGEQHGFRKAETIVRCLEAELAFYSDVLEVPASPDAT